ncbi:MAG: hypothetical protein R3Y58_03780 [Eubacteriales bacterium]
MKTLDKYEYRVKTEQIQAYVARKDYRKAMEVTDTIDWRRVKNADMLCTVSEIYENNGQFEKSRDILFIAYDRAPENRKIVYRLGILALKLGDTAEAMDCYEEFLIIAPKDPNQYILRYKILKVDGSSITQQIEALERFKKVEYVERWAYELAVLYHQAGMISECLTECDDLVLWFSDGKHVAEALELKLKYKPLTRAQQDKYNQYLKKQGLQPLPEFDATPKKVVSQNLAGTTPKVPVMADVEPVVAEPIEELVVDAPTEESLDTVEKAGATTIINEKQLQAIREASEPIGDNEEAVQETTRINVEAVAEELEKVAIEEPVIINPKPQVTVVPSTRMRTTNDEDGGITGQMRLEEILSGWEEKQNEMKVAIAAEKAKADQAKAEEEARIKAEEAIRLAEEERLLAEQKAKELEDEALEEEPILPDDIRQLMEDIENGVESKFVVNYDEKERRDLEPRENKAALVKNLIDLEEAYEEETYEDEEYDDEAYEDEAYEDEAYEDEAYEDEAYEDEEYEDEVYEDEVYEDEVYEDEVYDDELVDEIPVEDEEQSDESLEFESTPIADENLESFDKILASSIAEAFSSEEDLEDDDFEEESYEEETEFEYEDEGFAEEVYEEEAEFEYEDEGFAEEVYEEEAEFEYEDEGFGEEVYEEEAEFEEVDDFAEPTSFYAESPNEDFEVYDSSEEARLRFEQDEEVHEADMQVLSREHVTPSRIEMAKAVATGKTAKLPTAEIARAVAAGGKIGQDTGFIVQARYDLDTQSEIGLRAGLTEDQKKLFSYFVPVRGMSEQLVDVLERDKHCTNRQGTSKSGNLLIIGRKGSGKTVLAVDVVKAIQKNRNIAQGKVAIITGEALNKKKISDIIGKLYGGALIIEKANEMNEKTVIRLNKAMERETGELLVVLEDQRKPLDNLLVSNMEFRKKFTSRLEVPIFINDELVTFGQTYAKENEYRIDEMGILALYSRIDAMQREDHAVTVSEVKDILDGAMEHSKKASVKGLAKRLFRKGEENDGRVVLTEKDFH